MATLHINSTLLGLQGTDFTPRAITAELLLRERRLAIFGAALITLLIPMALAMLFDDRSLRGLHVWLKPMKFALSIGLFALTTAWFVGHLPVAQRSSRAVNWIVWLLIGSGSFEFFYILLQAGLGQGSHYNIGDAWHATMYSLMGVAAIILTATQPMLAWQLQRHPDPQRPAALRLAVLLGLLLCFVFGAGIGGLLSSMQPPDGGATMPLFGWSLSGGDLRPAHFIGIHSQQLLPLIGVAAVAFVAARARTIVITSTLAYSALFFALTYWGLAGRF